MKFLGFHSHRPVPEAGFLIMNGRVRLQIPLADGKERALEIMNLIGKYTTHKEWAVMCEWTHCYYITIKEHVNEKRRAKEHCKKSGYTSIIDCQSGKQLFL